MSRTESILKCLSHPYLVTNIIFICMVMVDNNTVVELRSLVKETMIWLLVYFRREGLDHYLEGWVGMKWTFGSTDTEVNTKMSR